MSAPVKKAKPSFEIDDLILNPNIILKLKEAGILTFKRILHLSSIELQKIAKLTALETKITLKAVSSILLKNEVILTSDIVRKEKVLRQFLQLNILKDKTNSFAGIFTGTVTEICGESGSGKTQLCLHLSILAQLPISSGGLNSKVVYIHTEGDFPIKRFMQLVSTFKLENPEAQAINLSDNLILRKVHNLNAMVYVIKNIIPDIAKKLNPKLIIIDSIAALLRLDFESVSARTSTIQNFAAEISKLATEFGFAVICVNQVSGQVAKKTATASSCITDVPSLGLLWSNILTTRLKISRKVSETDTAIRVLECIYSSYHPRIAVNFKISEAGIKLSE